MYVCKRCNYETSIKCNFKKHLNRKKICEVINEDVSVKQMMNELNPPKSLQNPPNHSKTPPKSLQNPPKKSKIRDFGVKGGNSLFCPIGP